MANDRVKVEVQADISQFESSMKTLTDATNDFGRTFTSTFSKAVQTGQKFDDFLKSLGRKFADKALVNALKPLEELFDNFFSTLLSSLGTGFSKGGVFSNGGVVPFARGGVISSPSLFSFGQRLGVMGEAGPEAILPLQKGSDGKLGVAGGGGSAKPVNVVFNVQASDVASFRKSESQISTMLARVVSRGQRGL